MISFKLYLSESTEDEFLTRIRTNPRDYTAWLIFADWLEERGDQRSETIRALVQLSKRDALKRKKNVNLISKVNQLVNSVSHEFQHLLQAAFPKVFNEVIIRGMLESLDRFTESYLEAILFGENDDSTPQGGEPLDRNYGIEDFFWQSLSQAIRECKDFQRRYGELIGHNLEGAGRDFYYTRQDHGVGFWDRDRGWGEDADTLSDAARAYQEVYFYVHDGIIYSNGGRIPR